MPETPQLRPFLLERFADYLTLELGTSPRTLEAYQRDVARLAEYALRTYFRFLLADGAVARDPSERLETPKRWRTLPEVLTVDEVSHLLAAPTLDDRGSDIDDTW